MKTNDAHNSRSEHAKNEKRDSQGRFTSSASKTSKTKSEHTDNEKKDSQSSSHMRNKK
ncbi:MAG: hypothetical protein E6772_02140 [Dysgonomonas sp.]|nr:hypothetical protein [Dysgonomonas sp.]